jgi:hypothetical protein
MSEEELFLLKQQVQILKESFDLMKKELRLIKYIMVYLAGALSINLTGVTLGW